MMQQRVICPVLANYQRRIWRLRPVRMVNLCAGRQWFPERSLCAEAVNVLQRLPVLANRCIAISPWPSRLPACGRAGLYFGGVEVRRSTCRSF